MSDLERARAILLEGGYTCVLTRCETIHTATARGVKPLVDWLDSGLELMEKSLRGFLPRIRWWAGPPLFYMYCWG